MKKTLVIINPECGSGNGFKFYNKYIKQFQNEFSFDLVLTEFREHASQICRDNGSKYDRIVTCGGDGTFNEVINGIDKFENIELSLIPVGSGNDFAGNFVDKLTHHERFLRIFNDNYTTIKIDIGNIRITDHEQTIITRRFVNSCGIGFDAYVAHLNQNTKKIKGKLSYIYSILVGLIKSKALEIEANFDEYFHKGINFFISIGNGKTAGGGLYLTPTAELTDKKLDYTLVGDISKLKLIRKLPLAIINKIHKVEEVSFGKFIAAEIVLKNPYYVHVDGESISSSAKNIQINLHHEQFNFIIM